MPHYDFNIIEDTAKGALASDALKQRINSDPLITIHCSDVQAIKYIEGVSGTLRCHFLASLSTDQYNVLSSIVAQHDGVNLPSSGATLVELLHPTMEDGKPVFTPAPGTMGWRTWFCGAGDAPGQRGGGDKMRLSFSDSGTDQKLFSFSEPIEINDGQGIYTGQWTLDDTVSFSAVIPASFATPAPGGNSGNCNQVQVEGMPDGSYRYEPAPGTGTHNIDLSLASPVPSGDSSDWSADYKTGDVHSPEISGQGKFNLYSFEVETFFMSDVPLGSPLGVLDVEVYKVDWIHQNWNLKVSVNKTSSGAGEFAMWLMIFRPGNTTAIT